MKNFRQKLFVILPILLISSFFISSVAFGMDKVISVKSGQTTKNFTDMKAAIGDTSTSSLPDIVANVIKWITAILGMILLVIVVYAGFLWMTSGGEPAKTEKAKKLLSSSVVGLVIVLIAYTLTDFILVNLTSVIGINP